MAASVLPDRLIASVELAEKMSIDTSLMCWLQGQPAHEICDDVHTGACESRKWIQKREGSRGAQRVRERAH